MMIHSVIPTRLGNYIFVEQDGLLTGIYRQDQAHFPSEIGDRDDKAGTAAKAQLLEYLAGKRREFELELAPQGTDFQLAVWQQLRTIGYGQTCSYGELANRLGKPAASRAVGAAVGRNPLSIVVPCHRVIGSSGQITGYAGGVETKQALLELEAS